MPAAAHPENEHSRQALLEALGILDTAPEEDYADIVRIASQVCEVPTAMISLVDARRQWFMARIGMEHAETPREASFCAHAILDPDTVLEVPDARRDARFADNPLVTREGVCFYAGAPVLVDGLPIGTVCVIDRAPRELEPAQAEALAALARQAARMIELRRLARMMKIQLREREWYERHLLDQHRALEGRLPAGTAPAGLLDPLTGLPGAAAFEALADEEIWLHGGARAPLHVVLMEVDDLDGIREVHGAAAADEVLAQLARHLRSGGLVEGRVARVDAGFGLLMPVALSPAIAQCVRVCDLMGNAAAGIPVTLSVGIACIEPGQGGAGALASARAALAQARAHGGDRIEVR